MSAGNSIVVIDGAKITDEASLHDLFYDAFGFPGWYGRNWNAWIDCMSYLDDPESGMTSLTVQPGRVVVLQIENQRTFKAACTEVFDALIECSSFVNYNRTKDGDDAILALAFHT